MSFDQQKAAHDWAKHSAGLAVRRELAEQNAQERRERNDLNYQRRQEEKRRAEESRLSLEHARLRHSLELQGYELEHLPEKLQIIFDDYCQRLTVDHQAQILANDEQLRFNALDRTNQFKDWLLRQVVSHHFASLAAQASHQCAMELEQLKQRASQSSGIPHDILDPIIDQLARADAATVATRPTPPVPQHPFSKPAPPERAQSKPSFFRSLVRKLFSRGSNHSQNRPLQC